jgi:UDP-N-acetylglucosamine 2-epimerase (hydrolysing)
VIASVLFVTGTRADFGKLKSLIRVVEESSKFRCRVFVTGMHTLARYGNTQIEVKKEGLEDIHVFYNQHAGEAMDTILANTIHGLSRYVNEKRPDLIIVHGDRVEALAGAIVGSLNNIVVAHVEGGERSGTVDELIRHAISKLSHVHLVAHEEARTRLVQMGELPESVFVIGSPDIDIMLSDELPAWEATRTRYGITFDQHGVLLYHPVTTELSRLREDTENLLQAVVDSQRNFVVIYPNNDPGQEVILELYARLRADKERFRIVPSMRFEYFLSTLKAADFIVGNSSAGIREAPVFGVPAINVGTRQQNRHSSSLILNVGCERVEIREAIAKSLATPLPRGKDRYFGTGNAAESFLKLLNAGTLDSVNCQKSFNDISSASEGVASALKRWPVITRRHEQ